MEGCFLKKIEERIERLKAKKCFCEIIDCVSVEGK